MSHAIEIEHLSFRYTVKAPPVLRDVHLTIKQGEFLGIVGPNGGGKSTLLKLILGLLKPQQGSVKIFGQKPEAASSLIGHVPQHVSFARDFPLSVEEVALMGRLGQTANFGPYRRRDRLVVSEVLEKIGILSLKKKLIGELSGGQLQKVLMARALVGNPRILVLDEPTSGVDPHGEENIFDVLKELNKEMTILLVSHDIAFVSHYIHEVACVNQTVEVHQTSALTGEDIHHLYEGHVRHVHHED